MKVEDLANSIFIDAGSPDSTSVAAIAFWIRGKIGDINVLLYEDFHIDETDGTYEILDGDGAEIDINACAVIKKIYEVYDLQVQIRTQMNAISADTILSFREADGSSFSKINRNSVSQTLASIRKDELQSLKDLVTAYRIKKSCPIQVVGDDLYEGIYDPNYNGGTFRNFNQ
jgi:hypothetical protein